MHSNSTARPFLTRRASSLPNCLHIVLVVLIAQLLAHRRLTRIFIIYLPHHHYGILLIIIEHVITFHCLSFPRFLFAFQCLKRCAVLNRRCGGRTFQPGERCRRDGGVTCSVPALRRPDPQLEHPASLVPLVQASTNAAGEFSAAELATLARFVSAPRLDSFLPETRD